MARYEELRAAALGADSGGGHGLALLGAKGMAAWMGAWRALRPCPPPLVPQGGVVPDGVVAVLASMAAACLGE